MNLNKITKDWLDGQDFYDISEDQIEGAEQMIKCLESRIPELTERIEKELVDDVNRITGEFPFKEKIIESLTE